MADAFDSPAAVTAIYDLGMASLGQELQVQREHSWYRHRADLAARADVSKRTLELIESDRVLPKPETLVRILDALGAPEADRQRLRRLRDRLQAERDGFDVPELDDLLGPRLAEAAAVEAVVCLRRRRHSLTQGDVRAVRAAVRARLMAVLKPASP